MSKRRLSRIIIEKINKMNPMWAIVLGCFFIVIGSFGVYLLQDGIRSLLHSSPLTNPQLAQQATDMATQVLEFLTDREKNEPAFDSNKWQESVDAQSKYSRETVNTYTVRYGSRVVYLRDRLKEYGLSDKQLDLLCSHATNTLVIRAGATALGNLAQHLAQREP